MPTTLEERQVARDVRDRLIGKNVIHRSHYPSQSSNRTYTVLTYADHTKSCNCPSWTRRRPGPDGQRTCKHLNLWSGDE